MRKAKAWYVIAMITGIVFFTVSPGMAQTYRWMTGSPGGSFFPLGGALKGFVEASHKDIRFEIMHGGGLANLKGIEAGKCVLGFANSVTTVDALNGAEPFEKPYSKLRNVANLYPQYFQMVTLEKYQDINSPADFKGKSVASQVRGTTGEAFLNAVLKESGLAYDDLSKLHQVGYNDAVNLMKDGHAHVFTLVTTIPAGAIMDLGTARDIKLIPASESLFNGLRKTMPGLLHGTIPSGTYPRVDRDIPSLTWTAHIVASDDAPDEVIYAVTKAVAEHVNELAGIARAVEGLTPEKMAADVGVPFHPGAAKFYAELGIKVKTE